MNHENNDIDERIKKQQEILFELDKHYQECTLDLINQVEQLEKMVNDLKKSNPNSNVSTTLNYSSNANNNANNNTNSIPLSISPEKNNPSNTINIH